MRHEFFDTILVMKTKTNHVLRPTKQFCKQIENVWFWLISSPYESQKHFFLKIYRQKKTHKIFEKILAL